MRKSLLMTFRCVHRPRVRVGVLVCEVILDGPSDRNSGMGTFCLLAIQRCYGSLSVGLALFHCDIVIDVEQEVLRIACRCQPTVTR